MHKEITKGHEARLKIKAGIDKACDAVRPTLGAVGMTAFIEVPGLDPIECDDGVTILRQLDFKDKYENIGLQMLRKAGVRTSTEGGDGTATTTVLTQALVNEAFKEIAQDSSKIREVRERLEKGLQQVLAELSKIKRDVTEEDIEKIATIASLDAEIAKLIADTIKEVGVNGVVTVEKGAQLGYSKEVVTGARFNRGLNSPYFINEPEEERCVLDNPHIVLVDRRVSTAGQIQSIMEAIQKSGNLNVLFIADDIDGVALASLVQNNSTVTVLDQATGATKKGAFNIACVRNPYTATPARDFLFDIASLTGATVISEESGMRLDEQGISICGSAEKVIVTKDSTTIIGGKDTEKKAERVATLKNQIENATSEYQKGMLKDRIASLTGGIGVIRVGAYTDTEFNAKRYKFENAINATQAALQEGILAGGGSALKRVALHFNEEIFKRALTKPFEQMCTNANVFENGHAPLTGDFGINFKTKEVVNMFDAGIIDPFKVTRLALESATSIAKSLVGMETAIITVDEKID